MFSLRLPCQSKSQGKSPSLPMNLYITDRRRINLAAAISKNRNEMAAGLTIIGTWMIFESPEPDVQPLWLGQAVAKTKWDNQCTWKNESNRIHRANGGVQIPPGGYAINVQWYGEVGSLEYIIEKESPLTIVQINYNLILAGFEMDLVVWTRIRVPRTRNVRDEYCMFDFN